jgi:putative addiction module killer protein
VRQIVRGRIARVQNGLLGDCKSVGAGVFELRIKTGPGFRVYFGIDNGRVVILLCAGDKSSQPFDIKLARKYWKDWEERS